MINNNRTNREKLKASATTSGTLSAVNGTTVVITSNRRISLATEGLKPSCHSWINLEK